MFPSQIFDVTKVGRKLAEKGSKQKHVIFQLVVTNLLSRSLLCSCRSYDAVVLGRIWLAKAERPSETRRSVCSRRTLCLFASGMLVAA
jgi:hypothetical protein